MSSPLWQQWQAQCQSRGLPVSDAWLARFGQLYALLLDANKTLNLTRITDPADFLNRHILEGLLLTAHIPQNARVGDVGSGGGFPALPMALLRPDITVTAIEAVGKKCRFIEATAEALQLQNVQTLSLRSEDMARDTQYREGFDVLTARAVAALPVLLEMTVPLLKPQGVLLALKGSRYPEEVAGSHNALKLLSAEIITTEENFSGGDGALLVIQKKATTLAAYPRKGGLIRKNPL